VPPTRGCEVTGTVCLETVRQSEVPPEPLFCSLSARSSSCHSADVLLQAAKEEEENSSQNPNGNHLLSKILHPTACTTKNKEFRENFVENRQIAKFRCQK
jgi:hypothetical protein